MAAVFAGVKGAGVLDFVCAWYLKAADYIRQADALARHSRESGNRSSPAGSEDGIRCAFVSTNSITQGEQVGILWAELYRRGMHIQFAHRTFKWSNEARGKAAVFCVIVGFALGEANNPRLFDYEKKDGDPQEILVHQINAYLVDADPILLPNRKGALCRVPPMLEGSALIDDGHLVLSDEEMLELSRSQPEVRSWIKPFAAGSDYINGVQRWCLWLAEASPIDIKAVPEVMRRLECVRGFRLNSGRQATKALAATPSLFGEIRQPASRYVMLPKTSSERRSYVPMGFLEPDFVINNTSLSVADASLYHFGVLTSQMHMAWLRSVGGRLKSDYRYSAGIVYNNFPWPELSGAPSKSDSRLRGNDEQEERRIGEQGERGNDAPDAHGNDAPAARAQDGQGHKHRAAIEAAAQAVLGARAQFPEATLADLYDPLTMPPALVKAHAALDKAVDAAYLAAEKAAGRKPPRLDTDAERVAFLFQRYQALTSLLPADKPKKPRKAKGAA